ncbi:MAG: hypothetical protein HC836_11485 [Richelia sp. RM2_1_2]|uniref:Uncharacterized protein n=1 Tax=Plectonema cf. radiosum LEGE 06105 TaxID=945769 RepID=A0A8J7EZN6_9CYAN|nr:hypothetical protein [Plectonema radiosum]NJL78484.1 hypothetical protein [Richelia sp. SM2_1_7]NJM22212.1 hypothetical protein [Richelia sp. SM1_7_0]NJN06553.1 hypothetical protein [Richelia sp. RM1_1_1]NJO28285.1 hypothetical protein [Richelia sp. SL_2_1]NJO58931.1 hypothetical protein [Richelia sp. RM2_1_2]
MNTQEKARALMQGHYQTIKNRQQSMLERAGEQIGLPEGMSRYWNPVQGKITPGGWMSYDSSCATMS